MLFYVINLIYQRLYSNTNWVFFKGSLKQTEPGTAPYPKSSV